jgi:hypothetical protein
MAMPTTPVARVLIRRSSDEAIGEHFVERFCETPILNAAADPTTDLVTRLWGAHAARVLVSAASPKLCSVVQRFSAIVFTDATDAEQSRG